MEEILASIRRILNEDDPAVQPVVPDAGEDDDVLVLDRSMMVATQDDAAQEAPRAQPIAPAPRPNLMEVPTPPPNDMDELVAPSAAAAAASSLGNLARSLSSAARPTQVWAGGPTLEDIVRSELRPLLKDWLDSNLPQMVERLVKAEIDRVAGRPGS